jgi:hypothetical protein
MAKKSKRSVIWEDNIKTNRKGIIYADFYEIEVARAELIGVSNKHGI